MNTPAMILQVGLSTPLNRLFDYLPPAGTVTPQPGQRVRVPFGRREIIGVITGIATRSEFPLDKLRAAIEILDEEPLLDKDMLALLRWAASYYQYPVGEVFAAAMPGQLRKGATTDIQPGYQWQVTQAGREVDLAKLTKKASARARLLEALLPAPATDEQLRKLHSGWRKLIAALTEQGWVEQTEVFATNPTADSLDQPPELTAGQSTAVKEIADNGFHACLLEGVTGSGKTEVYLQLITRQLKQNRQTLVLVPEIGLTPQLIDRFRRRVAGHIVVLHSGLTDTQRLEAWLEARSGAADVVIGTRSAIFVPLARPGLLIIDEEHDGSYKQQDGFRYSARDLAVYRARQMEIPVVLGSATPAFETLNNALEKRYQHILLPERPGNAEQPEPKIIDLRKYPLRDGLSQPFIDALRSHLASGGQGLIYLNRRGFAPTLLCPGCGETEECKRCDARMVLHQRQRRLACHHCGSERPAPEKCAECDAELIPVGLGTERLEQSLEKLFPEYPLVRIDRDSIRKVGELEKRLDAIRNKEARILLGTQMLTKGHDFPDVSFVGIVDSDQGLFGTDFRSAERLAQSILQVAGRAGRGERPGEVWIQTYYPDHPLLQTLLTEGYSGFATAALAERRAAVWPPFSHLALLRSECADREQLFRFLEQARERAASLASEQIRILGPATSPMERRSGRYRAQLLIQSGSRAQLQKFLYSWREQVAQLDDVRRVRWSLDVDPAELF